MQYNKEELKYPNCLKSVDWIKGGKEIVTCDFYNDKICKLFSEYFKFKIECKKLNLYDIEGNEKECPYKQLEHLQVKLDYLVQEYKHELKKYMELDAKYCQLRHCLQIEEQKNKEFLSDIKEVKKYVTNDVEFDDIRIILEDYDNG